MEIRLTDEQAIQSLVEFAKNHRAAIATWAADQFEKVGSPADKASFALEVLENYIAAVEELEMLYFALQAKLRDPGRSLLDHYFHVSINEEGPGGKVSATSAAEILRQLPGLTPEAFAASLGLPTMDEYVALLKGLVGDSEDQIKHKYREHLGALKHAVEQAVTNRSKHKLMRLYNKMKHGFSVLIDPSDNSPFSIQSVASETGVVSKIEGAHVLPSADRLREMAGSCQRLALAMRELMLLYSRKVPGVTG